MNTKKHLYGVLALALSGLTANACILPIRVACPNDRTAEGIEICVEGVGCVKTDNLGIALIDVGGFGTFNVCVTANTLPAGATLKPLCQKVTVVSDAPAPLDFVLTGDFCSTPPPPGPCWMTGGGTIGKGKGTPEFSYGGVVYPGCSPNAAGGGNWNVIDHASGLHFQGKTIIVDGCTGVPTKSPKVNVNIIDFHGEGIIGGIGGNDEDTSPVTFVGRVVDKSEPGGGSDLIYIEVFDGGGDTVLLIGVDQDNPSVTSTGNLQIHTSSCAN